MSINSPSISVLIPARNAAATLRQAIESILYQSGPSVELILINDHSTDSTVPIARSFGDSVRVISNNKPGIANALNAGLAAVRGKYLARCDADDLYPPNRLARQFEWLETHPDFAAIVGCFSTFGPTGVPIEMATGSNEEEITSQLQQGNVRTHLCTSLLHTEVVKRLGGFRPWFITAEDIDLQLRLSEVGRIWYEPTNCYFYRLHDQSITHQVDSTRRVFFDESARNFQRQRQATGVDDLQRNCPPALPRPSAPPMSARQQNWDLLMHQSWVNWSKSRTAALKTGLQCCRLAPMRWRSWRNLAALALKPGQPCSIEKA